MLTVRLPPLLPSLCLLGLAACTSSPQREMQSPWPPLQPAELGEMHNVAVSEGLWIGSQPCETDLDLAARRQIQRVVNLRVPELQAGFDLPQTCARLGLEYVEIGLDEDGSLSDTSVDLALGLLEPRQPQPRTLLFCADGSRAVLIFAIHRVVHEQMPVASALAEAHRVGLRQSDDPTVQFHVQRLANRTLSGP